MKSNAVMKDQLNVLLTLLTLASFSIVGCDVFGADDGDPDSQAKKLLVTNQGNFSDENGSLSLYSLEDSTVNNNIVAGFSGLPQSVTVSGNMAYVLVNTSTFNGGRIDIIDLNSNTRVGQVADVAAPRYLAFGPDNKAYVSNLFNGTVSVINTIDNSISAAIPVGSNPEGVLFTEEKIIVANYGFGADSTLSVIDPSLDTVVQTVDLECDGPRTLSEIPGTDDFLVICSGNTIFDSDFNVIGRTDGQVLFVSKNDLSVTTRIDNLDSQLGASSFGLDAAVGAGKIYVARDQEIVVIDIATRSASSLISLDSNVSSILSVNDKLFVGTYDDFTTAGKLHQLSKTGQVETSVSVGVAPGHLVTVSAL